MNETGTEPDSVAAVLKHAMAKARGHADFFDWPNRSQKESAIAEEALRSADITDAVLAAQTVDPPDCVFTRPSGRIGVEVTEFVDQKSIEILKKSDAHVFRSWSRSEFLEKFGRIVAAKDSPKEIFGGPYRRYYLVVHCDETAINYEFASSCLDSYSLRTQIVDEVIFLISYDPAVGKCPSIRLRAPSWSRPFRYLRRLWRRAP